MNRVRFRFVEGRLKHPLLVAFFKEQPRWIIVILLSTSLVYTIVIAIYHITTLVVNTFIYSTIHLQHKWRYMGSSLYIIHFHEHCNSNWALQILCTLDRVKQYSTYSGLRIGVFEAGTYLDCARKCWDHYACSFFNFERVCFLRNHSSRWKVVIYLKEWKYEEVWHIY